MSTTQIGDYSVMIEAGPQKTSFRLATVDRLDELAAKAIQSEAGLPSSLHGFESYLCYRDEFGLWQIYWHCLTEAIQAV